MSNQQMKIMRVLTLFLTGLFAAFVIVSCIFGHQVVTNSTHLVDREETMQVPQQYFEKNGFTYEEYLKTYKVESFSVPSSFGDHEIPGDWIYTPDHRSDKVAPTIIMVHGLGGNRYSNYPLAQVFLNAGYHVVTYDQRATGENQSDTTTFGYLEKEDLLDIIAYVKRKAPDEPIGLWGTSLGGATVGLALGKDPGGISFAILDCPVSSMRWMIHQELSQMDTGLTPGYLTTCGTLVSKITMGFYYGMADVPKAMKKVTVPTLIMNSKADTVTPYFMGSDIYEALPGEEKELWTLEDAEHACLWEKEKENYSAKILEWARKYGTVVQ